MVDVNKPVENPALVVAIEALQKNPCAETEAALFEQLRQANFLLVLHKKISETPGENGTITLSKGTTISFPLLADGDGNPMHFGFTDWPALYAWNAQPNQQTLIVPFEELPDLILREGSRCTGFLINPATHTFFIPKTILAHVSGRAVPYTVQEDTKVQLGTPRELPHALMEAVTAQLENLPNVSRAWLMLMKKEDEMSYLIVLEHTGDRDTVSHAVGSAASPHLPKGMFVDIVTTDQDFGRGATQGRTPFYERG